MKNVIAVFLLLVSSGLTFAQQKSAAGKIKDEDKVLVCGSITTAHNLPVNGVQAFVYRKDSTIAASGYSDADGKYSTNVLVPGEYYMKFVYPSNNVVMITGIAVKGKGNTVFNLKLNEPGADTVLNYTDLYPKAEAKKKGSKKK